MTMTDKTKLNKYNTENEKDGAIWTPPKTGDEPRRQRRPGMNLGVSEEKPVLRYHSCYLYSQDVLDTIIHKQTQIKERRM